MYWFRIDEPLSLIMLVSFIALIWFGGWMFARHSFKIRSRERVFVGLGLGVALFVAVANALGRIFAPEIVFWLTGIIIGLTGLFVGLRSKLKLFGIEDVKVARQFLLFTGLTILVTLLGRGLGIFDDRKNLSIISLMAAGDIPPHFYMNSGVHFSYHYGFQLFAAALMRVGNLFPWSAFDLTKGIMGALVLNLALIWGWRGSKRFAGGLLLAGWVALASGTRWILLLLPSGLVQRMAEGLTLWGSGLQSTTRLLEGLSSAWILEGGPPIPIPFAYVNGVMQPFILHAQAGPKSLAMVVLLLLLLLIRRRVNITSDIILVLILATWALAAEAEFVIFVFAILSAGISLSFWKRNPAWRSELRRAMGMVTLAGFISILQGGTITQFVLGWLEKMGQPETVAAVAHGFGFRSPPALVSSHLGEMKLHIPGQLIIGLLEMGPLLLVLPFVLWMAVRWRKRGDFLKLGLSIAALLSFIIPILVTYSVDRDITRFTNFSLYLMLFLGWEFMTLGWRFSKSAWVRSFIVGLIGVSSFAGVMVLGALMTALPRAVFTDEIAVLDASMAREFWDKLPQGSEILDSSNWRAVALTGRLTRSAMSSSTSLESYEKLRSNPTVESVTASGFDYVYIDQMWWNGMPEGARSSYAQSCVKLVGESFDNSSNGSRWLYDLSACAP